MTWQPCDVHRHLICVYIQGSSSQVQKQCTESLAGNMPDFLRIEATAIIQYTVHSIQYIYSVYLYYAYA
jgi:hypothetical protein